MFTTLKDGADIRNLLDEDGTTVKSGSTKSHFLWDHGKNERHFIHGSSQLSELVLYVGHGYFSSFCTRVHKLLRDKVHYAFSSAYLTAPENVAQTTPDPHVIPYENGDLDPEDPIHQWYTLEPDDKVSKAAPSINKTPIPKRNVSWSNDTKLPTPNGNKDPDGFQLGMELMYRNGQVKNLPVVYEGANADVHLQHEDRKSVVL